MESAFRDPELKLIETFGWDGKHFVRLERHKARLAQSAATLGFPYEEAAFRTALPAGPGSAPRRLRITLDREGRFELTTAPLPANPPLWRIAIAPDRIVSTDPRLAHKTTDRALYDRTRAALPEGTDEAIFLNERNEVTEGTITTLFFDLGHGLRTPPLNAGCLPGCLRAELLATGQAREEPLHAADLAQARLWLGNSLRGLIPAQVLTPFSV